MEGLNEDGYTPLIFGAELGSDAACEVLLVNDASPNAQMEENGYTALHAAAAAGQSGIVEMLLESEADPSVSYSCSFPSPEKAFIMTFPRGFARAPPSDRVHLVYARGLEQLWVYSIARIDRWLCIHKTKGTYKKEFWWRAQNNLIESTITRLFVSPMAVFSLPFPGPLLLGTRRASVVRSCARVSGCARKFCVYVSPSPPPP